MFWVIKILWKLFISLIIKMWHVYISCACCTCSAVTSSAPKTSPNVLFVSWFFWFIVGLVELLTSSSNNWICVVSKHRCAHDWTHTALSHAASSGSDFETSIIHKILYFLFLWGARLALHCVKKWQLKAKTCLPISRNGCQGQPGKWQPEL